MGIQRNLAPALVLALGLASVASSADRVGQDVATQGNVSGKANKNTAKGDLKDYSVRARNVDLGQIGDSVSLDAQLQLTLKGLSVPGKYMIELYDNKHNKKVCQEGPYDLTDAAPIKADVFISCGKPPVGYIALAAAAVAGVTTGVVLNASSPSQ